GAPAPITRDGRRGPGLGNMADQRGLSSAVLGLWATYPAEAVRGVIVSDRLFSFQAGGATGPGIVSPAGREAWAREALRKAEQETGYDALHAMLPSLERGAYDRLLD